MGRGINKVILVGSLGKDPEIRYTGGGAAVASFSIATNESWKDKTSGEMVENTEWHNITAFGRLAEICGEYLKKGSQVYVEGKLQTDKWQDKSGADRYTTKVIIREMQMLGGRPDSAGSPDGSSAPQSSPAQSAPQAAPYSDDIPYF